MSPLDVEVELLALRHREGLLALFGAASAGCFCRFWHFEGEDNDWLARCASGQNADGLVVGDAASQGVVALLDGEVVGWLKLCPAAQMKKLEKRRVYRTLPWFESPRDDTLVIGCVLVRRDLRRHGIARALVRGAVDAARQLGATAVEAFPRVAEHELGDHELQMGPAAIYAAMGFVSVDGPTLYPVMRLSLES